MENHTGQSGNFPKEDPPLKLIVDLCAQLADMGLEFQISLKIKDSLQFSLKSDNKASGQSAGGKRRRGASYRRRQMRRRAAYLEKKRASPEKGGEGVSGLIQDGSDQLDTGEHNISLDLDPTPIHWRGAPKGSVDEEPTEDKAVGMAADLEQDRAAERSGVKWESPGVGSGERSNTGGSGGQTTVATPWRCGPSTTSTGSTKMETTSLSLLQEESTQLMFQLDYQMLPLSMEK